MIPSDTGVSLELVRPWMLWALVLLAPVAWYFHRSLSDVPRWQRVASLICRCSIVVLLVLALAGLALLSPSTEQYVVVAIDRSLSIDEEATQKIDAFLKDASNSAGDNRLAYIAFAAESKQIAHTVEELGEFDEPKKRGPTSHRRRFGRPLFSADCRHF